MNSGREEATVGLAIALKLKNNKTEIKAVFRVVYNCK